MLRVPGLPAHLADDERLSLMVDVARDAARLIRDAWRRFVAVEVKSPTNYVTAVDRAVEKMVLERLQTTYPDDDILAEESTEDVATIVADPPERLWVVDPLDGTTNFTHRYPWVSVSIGFAERGTVTRGVVIDAVRRELFVARRGDGAYLNGRRLAVSRTTDLRRALIGIGTPYDAIDLPESLSRIVALRPWVSDVRRDGSAALNLASVASGRLDAFVERPVSPWDYSAGILLATEAGATVTDAWGAPITLASGGVCAATPALHGQLLELVGREPLGRLVPHLLALLPGSPGSPAPVPSAAR